MIETVLPVVGPARRGARASIAAAARDTVSVGFALAPIGVAFGLLLVQAGFDWWWAPLFSTLIYAGSLEFLAIGLILAVTPLAQIALTTFLVNFRHVFYALSFPLSTITGFGAKTYAMYALTDEAYALTAPMPRGSLDKTRVLAIQVFCQAYWIIGGTAGALLATVLPGQIIGLDFALTALFVVLAIDAYRAKRDIPTPIIALVSALLALAISHEHMLIIGMGLFVAGLVARYLLTRRASGAPTPGTEA